MKNLAVLLQLIGLILIFTIGVTGYVLGPLLIIGGGIWYRKETREIKKVEAIETTYPKEIDKWNWGAFFFNWIWGIGNNVYISLLCLVPIVNLVFIFILGSRGNRWAWEKGSWSSVEQFQATQRKWALWVIPVYLGIVLLSVSAVFGISAIMKSSEAYQLGIENILINPTVKNKIGEPIEIGFFTQGSIEIKGVMGKAELSVPVSGSKSSGKIYINATKKLGRWELNELVLILNNNVEPIYLLK